MAPDRRKCVLKRHIHALEIARELSEVAFLEEWGDKVTNGTHRLTRAKESAADEIQKWEARGHAAMDWEAATDWMIERMASDIDAKYLEDSRRQIAEMKRSKEYDRSIIRVVEDG